MTGRAVGGGISSGSMFQIRSLRAHGGGTNKGTIMKRRIVDLAGPGGRGTFRKWKVSRPSKSKSFRLNLLAPSVSAASMSRQTNLDGKTGGVRDVPVAHAHTRGLRCTHDPEYSTQSRIRVYPGRR
jgi:hypothetical protein